MISRFLNFKPEKLQIWLKLEFGKGEVSDWLVLEFENGKFNVRIMVRFFFTPIVDVLFYAEMYFIKIFQFIDENKVTSIIC